MHSLTARSIDGLRNNNLDIKRSINDISDKLNENLPNLKEKMN